MVIGAGVFKQRECKVVFPLINIVLGARKRNLTSQWLFYITIINRHMKVDNEATKKKTGKAKFLFHVR